MVVVSHVQYYVPGGYLFYLQNRDSMPAVYGIIGYPLTHSFSAGYFTKKFADNGINAAYSTFPLERISDFPALLQKQPGLRGLNVTIPYKESVMAYLDALDNGAKAIGAVNCISFQHSIKKGYNTDVIGFIESLRPLLKAHHRQALILGTGGASKAVAYALHNDGIEYISVSRAKSADDVITYNMLTPEIVGEHTLIINTTPLGMQPNVDTYPPIPYNAITPHHLVYDVVYTPEETKFLSLAKEQGATIKNGLEMFYLQAEASWKIWNS